MDCRISELFFLITHRFNIDDGVLMWRIPLRTFLELVDLGLFQVLGYCGMTANTILEGIDLEQG